MKKIEFWTPAIMCAVISLLTIVSIMLSSGDSTLFALIAFLPVCFVFAGTVMVKMNKEIVLLRQRIEELKQINVKINR